MAAESPVYPQNIDAHRKFPSADQLTRGIEHDKGKVQAKAYDLWAEDRLAELPCFHCLRLCLTFDTR